MPNLLARCESLRDHVSYQPPGLYLLISLPEHRSDRFTIIGFSQRATQEEIRQVIKGRPIITRKDRRPDQSSKPSTRRRQQHIPGHKK